MSNRAAIVSGNGWRAAKSLVTLYDEVVAAYPNRTLTADDATIGDAAHAARTSDHNPVHGVVCALDLTHDPRGGFDSYAFAERLRQFQDQRIKYVISNHRIFYGPRSPSHSGTPSKQWKWETYPADKDPHTDHIHISVDDPRYYDDTALWKIDSATPTPPVPPISDGSPELKLGSTGDDVRFVQQKTMVDGTFGVMTEAAVKKFQKANGLRADGIVGPLTWAVLHAPAPTPSIDEGWHVGITATFFGGGSDPQRSAYDGHLITESELAISLPARLPPSQREAEVHYQGKTVGVDAADIGPWYEDDPYWDEGRRPLAETPGPALRGPNKGRVTNHAGIDLSPGTVKALGVTPADLILGHAIVDWRFKPKEVQVPTTVPTPPVVTVPVTSDYASKINWTAAATALFPLLAAFGLNINEPWRTYIITGVPAVGGVLIMIFRTFFTKTITKSSV
jgi:peptidoglycan hydrolase-like protein with peptidoglycan-binding domain